MCFFGAWKHSAYETSSLQVGVALFKDHPDALYPFSSMDRMQRMYVEDVVSACMATHQRRSALVGITSSNCGSSSHSISSTSSGRVIMQMGGGCILYVEAGQSNSSSKPSRLKQLDVFEALCDCIFASKR